MRKLNVEIEISTPYNFNLNSVNFLTFFYFDTVIIQFFNTETQILSSHGCCSSYVTDTQHNNRKL
jgi:hypothetical protein